MKLVILLLFTLITYSQTYRTNKLNVRTNDGWEIYDKDIVVTFNESKLENTITITTNGNIRLFEVISKLPFIKYKSFIYIVEDLNYEESRIRIEQSDNGIDLYFYSNRIKEKYFKLNLIKI